MQSVCVPVHAADARLLLLGSEELREDLLAPISDAAQQQHQVVTENTIAIFSGLVLSQNTGQMKLKFSFRIHM